MSTNSQHIRWVARFFILFYLLLISGTGNTFFWCKDAEASSHLESNLSGTCWFPCLSESEDYLPYESSFNASLTSSSDMGDCVDSPAHSSVITRTNQNILKSKSTVTDINTPNFPFILAKCLNAEYSGSTSLTHQLPPRQTLAALRTVVLLH